MKQKSSLKTMIYQDVLDGIISGKFKAGQIVNEQELVKMYGCSKSPVREALVALCNDEVLKNLPRFGYEVVRLDMTDIRNMLEYRLFLEGGMLQQHIDKFTDEDFAELEQLDQLCNMSVEDMWVHWEHNTNFHLRLMKTGGNEYAYQQLLKTMGILKRAYAQIYWDKWNKQYNPQDMKSHQRILKCLKERNLECTLEYLRHDLQEFGACDVGFK